MQGWIVNKITLPILGCRMHGCPSKIKPIGFIDFEMQPGIAFCYFMTSDTLNTNDKREITGKKLPDAFVLEYPVYVQDTEVTLLISSRQDSFFSLETSIHLHGNAPAAFIRNNRDACTHGYSGFGNSSSHRRMRQRAKSCLVQGALIPVGMREGWAHNHHTCNKPYPQSLLGITLVSQER